MTVITLQGVRTHIRLVASIASALVAVTAAASAVTVYSEYLPATRGFAKETVKIETAAALSITAARIGNLQRESTETRLQINQVRRDGLRAEKLTREQQLQAASDPAMRQLLRQRLDEIADTLRDVDAERERLRLPQ